MTDPARLQPPGPDGEHDRTAAAGAPTTSPEPRAADLVGQARERWRNALVARAGDSALSDVGRLGDAQLDLSAAHPSGIAQLFAGRPTRLSNLVREGGALSAAKRRSRAVGALAEDHAQRFGLASAFLAIGVATWTEEVPIASQLAGMAEPDDDAGRTSAGAGGPHASGEGAGTGARSTVRTVRAPVLLRPVSITARGRGESDYDLVLEPSLEINPVLSAALRSQGALLDPAAMARGAFTAAGFDPRSALDRLASLGAALLTGFRLEDRLLVGTFVHPEHALVDDLDALADVLRDHEVLAALAGDGSAVAALAHPLPRAIPGDRPFEQEHGVGDLDPAQTHVLDAVAAGHHLLVDAPTGSDVAGTVAAVVADAAASGRTVLYVAGHRRAATALTDRLAALGLADVVLDVAPESDWRVQVGRRLLGAMTAEAVPVDADKVHIVRRELLDRRGRLKGYIDGLHVQREPWGASAYDALQALARLTAAERGPQTRVRLTVPVAEALDGERRAQATADLVHVSGLGAFSATIRSGPWHGADLVTADLARAALGRVDELLGGSLQRLRDEAVAVAEETGLTVAQSPAEWGEQLTMLEGVRGALDVFRPLVFERSAADLVAATASKEWRAERGIEMALGVRRRLRKQAKDMLRPGRPVADLHAALVDVQHQREVWQAHCPAGGWPRLPSGLAGIEADYRAVRADLDALSVALAGTAGGGGLAELPWSELVDRLRRLQGDRSALDTLPERTAMLRSLERRGLRDLLADLAERQVPGDLVGAELELAWWSTVFEEILRLDPALAGYDGAALARLVAEFRTLDRRHVADRAVLARAAARADLRSRLRSADEQAQALFGEIVEDRFAGLRSSVESHPDIARHLRPCLVSSPLLVPQLLPPARTEDLVVLDAAGHLPLESVVGALARGRQVLVIGDTRSASASALTRLATVLPTVRLRADSSRRDPRLTTFLLEHGYADRLTVTPLPSTVPLLRLDTVGGTGMPAPDGAVEGTRAEVEHVVELVVDHALARPEESLAVVTASAVHAERLREAILAEVRENPALGSFFRPDHPEPFVIVEVGATQGLSREAVILSVGHGRTPHGRVLHRFGALSEPGGEGRLLEALGSTRHRLVVVSCFSTADLDRERLRAPGALLLADLLELAGRQSAADRDPDAARSAVVTGPDRLVLDLAERLQRLGLVVELDLGAHGTTRIPLAVGHPDLPGELLVAVLTDDEAYVGQASVRVRDRQIPERLERLGWSVVQVWSAAAFLDPQGEAEMIADTVLAACHRRTADRGPRGDGPPGAGGPGVDRRGPEGPVRARSGEADTRGDGPGAPDRDPGDRSGRDAQAHDDEDGRAMEDDGDMDADRRGDAADDPHRAGDEQPGGPGPGAQADGGARRPPEEIDVDTLLAVRGDGPVLPSPGGRPQVEPGLPISAYTDDQLDELLAWIRRDGVPRDEEQLAAALRTELGLVRRGARVDAVVTGAVRRVR